MYEWYMGHVRKQNGTDAFTEKIIIFADETHNTFQ